MSFSARYVPAVLLIVLSFAGTLCAQSTNSQTNKTPRATVSGRITIKDKGAAGVAVGLRKSEDNPPTEPFLKAVTDEDGCYRFTNVSSGNYDITPSAPAFVIDNMYGLRAGSYKVSAGKSEDGFSQPSTPTRATTIVGLLFHEREERQPR